MPKKQDQFNTAPYEDDFDLWAKCVVISMAGVITMMSVGAAVSVASALINQRLTTLNNLHTLIISVLTICGQPPNG